MVVYFLQQNISTSFGRKLTLIKDSFMRDGDNWRDDNDEFIQLQKTRSVGRHNFHCIGYLFHSCRKLVVNVETIFTVILES